jgi:hypothetical protein
MNLHTQETRDTTSRTLSRRHHLLALAIAATASLSATAQDTQRGVKQSPLTTVYNPNQTPPQGFRVLSAVTSEGRPVSDAERTEIEASMRKRFPGYFSNYSLEQIGTALADPSFSRKWPKITIGVTTPKGYTFTATIG